MLPFVSLVSLQLKQFTYLWLPKATEFPSKLYPFWGYLCRNCSPKAHFYLHGWKSVDIYITPRSTKKSLDTIGKTNRKSAILNWTAIFGNLHIVYFNKLLLEIFSDSCENRCVYSWPLWDQWLLKSFGLESQCGRNGTAILSVSPWKTKCL